MTTCTMQRCGACCASGRVHLSGRPATRPRRTMFPGRAAPTTKDLEDGGATRGDASGPSGVFWLGLLRLFGLGRDQNPAHAAPILNRPALIADLNRIGSGGAGLIGRRGLRKDG